MRTLTLGRRRRSRLAPCRCVAGALPALFVLLLLTGCRGGSAAPDAEAVPVWGRWEHTLEAQAPAGPTTAVHAQFTAPSGATRTVDAFWDGGAVWRVRFMPDEAGTWRYRTTSVPAVEGLDGAAGTFVATSGAASENPFHVHGAVRVSDDGRYLVHADGTPFFWLGDTAWNGALRSTEADWRAYLDQRRAHRYSVIQFVTTQWRAALTSEDGAVAYTAAGDTFSINPAFFQRLDARLDAVNEAGLLAAPVLLWGLGDPEQYPVPGKLPEAQAVRLARYLVARYGAHHVAWILGGDANYGGDNADRWKRIGRAVFDTDGHAPVTLHPQGMQWHFDAFAEEPWLDFLMYQSGHGDSPETLRWIHSGPPAEKWRQAPARPVLNAEPPYEDHVAYQSKQPHTAYNVRRAVYWSLLNVPTAGVTYGAHGIWSWETEPAVPLHHEGSGTAKPWDEAVALPGSRQMQHVAALFTALDWWRLRPDSSLLAGQPGGDDPARFVAASRTEDGDLAVLYLPVGGTVELAPGVLAGGLEGAWYDPRTGSWTAAGEGTQPVFTAPDAQDWVLVLRPPGT